MREKKLNGPETSCSEASAVRKKPGKKARWVKRVLKIVLVLVIIAFFPWPADNSTYVGSDYQKSTLARLDEMPVSSAGPGPIRVGTAEVDITPPPGHPLAGFGLRIPKGHTNVHSRCYGRALTLASDSQMVTILTADLVTMHTVVADTVLSKTALPAEEIYFTATHTHAGPGGYVDRWMEEICFGKYNAEYFDFLTTKLAEVIKESRKELIEAEMAVLTIDASDVLKNRLDGDLPAYGKLSALVYKRTGNTNNGDNPLAVLISFAAHPTIINYKRHDLSSDYPGALVNAIKQRSGADMVLFAAGSVGQTGHSLPRPRPEGRCNQADAYGKLLADKLMEKWDTIACNQNLVMSNKRLEVDLPPFRMPVGKQLRLNPWLTGRFLDRQSHLHVIRIGNVVLAGFPTEYGSDLAFILDDWLIEKGLEFVPTSFNGDWRSYMSSKDTFFKYCDYETRLASFYGPWAGEYLNDVIKHMVERTIQPQQAQ